MVAQGAPPCAYPAPVPFLAPRLVLEQGLAKEGLAAEGRVERGDQKSCKEPEHRTSQEGPASRPVNLANLALLLSLLERPIPLARSFLSFGKLCRSQSGRNGIPQPRLY